MHKYKLVALLFFVASTLAAAQPPTIDIYTETKTAIFVTPNHPTFNLHLTSNPTTGYSWFLRDYDANVIQPVKQSFAANPDKKLMGAPGFENWTFKLKPTAFTVPQQTTVRLVYARPWEDATQAKQLIFRISTTSVLSSEAVTLPHGRGSV